MPPVPRRGPTRPLPTVPTVPTSPAADPAPAPRPEGSAVTTPPPAMPRVSPRVTDLHARMTLAQLVGYWIDHGGEVVAPMADEMNNARSGALRDVTEHGMGHYTRVYGTRPVEPLERAGWLWAEQRRLVEETRLGIPALVHEE